MNYQGPNPFDIESSYRIENKAICDSLDMRIEKSDINQTVSCAIYGLRGSGKSVFIDSYFNNDRLRKYASSGQLYPRLNADSTVEPAKLFGRICKTIIDFVDEYTDSTCLSEITVDTDESIDDIVFKLEKIGTLLKKDGYRVSVVIDEFQRVSRTKECEDICYGIIRDLYENNTTKMGFVVTTDTDFRDKWGDNADNLDNSIVMTVFDFETEITGMSKQVFCEYVKSFTDSIQEEVFSEEELRVIYMLSGGIPAVVRKVAQLAFELKQKGVGDELEKFLRMRAMQDLKHTYFDKWCSDLANSQKAFLKKTAEEGITESYWGIEGEAFIFLKKRCFFVEEESGYGSWRFCCELFRDYCKMQFIKEYESVYVSNEEKDKEQDIFKERKKELALEITSLYNNVSAKLEKIEGRVLRGFLDKTRDIYIRILKELEVLQTELAKSKYGDSTIDEMEKRFETLQSEFIRTGNFR